MSSTAKWKAEDVNAVIDKFDDCDEDDTDDDVRDDLTPGCDIKDSFPQVKGRSHEIVGDLVVVGEDEIVEACTVSNVQS